MSLNERKVVLQKNIGALWKEAIVGLMLNQ